MNNKATFLRVGLLLVAGVAAAVGLVLFLSRDQVRNGIEFETYSKESVQGLVAGAPVKFRGVQLGQVTEIALVGATYPEAMPAVTDPNAFELVVVRFTVDPKKLGRHMDPDRAVELGLRGRLANQGITGVEYIELDFVNPKQFPAEKVPWTPAFFYIPSIPSTIAQVQDAAQALLAKLQAIDMARLAGSVQTVLDDLHGQLAEGDLHQTLAEANLLLRSLHAAVDKADLPAVAADLRATSSSVRALVQSKDIKQMTSSAAAAADSFAEAGRALPPLLDTLESTVRHADDSVGDLRQELGPVLRDIRAAASNLRETTETLKRYPSSVLLGAPPPKGKYQ
jgi:paraquat-inducible protein B